MLRRLPLAVLALSPLVACSADAPAPDATRTIEAAAIYGDDDRTDYYAETDQALRTLTDQSIIAMIDDGSVDDSNPRDVRIQGASLGRSYGLCSDERFYDQPTAASCSATLIDDDLVLTAGHCVTSLRSCQRNRWVFRYYLESEDEIATITSDDVFDCEELLVQEQTSGRNGSLDYAIFRLDRPATPRFTPAPVFPTREPVQDGDPLIMIGFGSGLPAKIDAGGVVLDARVEQGDYFQASVDAFGGNSGSGVFDAAGRVVGILVAGDTDYEWRGGCGSTVVYPEQGSSFGGEIVTYAWQAVEELCASGYPSSRLCDFEDVCGDGICSGPENGLNCDADCVTECGDGVCEPGEDPDCIDCRAGVPVGWTCELSWYDAGDGCDCGCGIYDPDCDDPSQDIPNCDPGQTCNADGVCEGEPTGPVAPEGWICDAAFYDAGDGCDCGCGIIDPDCADPAAEVVGCAAGQVCIDGLCAEPEQPGGEDLPDETPSIDVDPGGLDEGEFGDVVIGADGRSITEGCAAGGRASASWLGLLMAGLAISRRRRAR